MFSGISDFLSLPFLNGIGGEWNWLVKTLAWIIIGGVVVAFKWVYKPIDEGFCAVRYRFGILERDDDASRFVRFIRYVPLAVKMLPYKDGAPVRVFGKGRVLSIFMYHRLSMIDCKELQFQVDDLPVAFNDRTGGRYHASCFFKVNGDDPRAIELREMRTNDPLEALRTMTKNIVARVAETLTTVEMEVLHNEAPALFVAYATELAALYGMSPTRIVFESATIDQGLELARAIKNSGGNSRAIIAAQQAPY